MANDIKIDDSAVLQGFLGSYEEEEFQRKMLEEQQAREAQRGRRQRGLEQFYRDLGLRVPNFDEPEVS